MFREELKQERNFLFLQGPLSPLYFQLGRKLKAEGFGVYRINLCAGDWFHWHGEDCVSFKGDVSEWPAFIENIIKDYSITDIILHGDRRLYHKIAIKIAKQNNLYIAVTELGILRPGWLTIEVNGLGLLSHFPNNPQYLLEQAARLPEPVSGKKYNYPFYQMALWDVSYNLINYFLFWLYPGYQRHTPYNPILEYSRAAFRLLGQKREDRKANQVIAKLVDSKIPYFVFPLQLNGDFQIRDYSSFSSMADATEVVLKSFTEHAPKHAHILVKQHPLDPGLDKLKSITLSLARKMNIEGRVHYVDGGDLDQAFKYSLGAVMVNSSAAIGAIDLNIPVKVLAPAVYDIPGLTFQGALDDFWESDFKPQRNIYNAFISVLKQSTQVPGALYGKEALKSAVNNIADKIIGKQLNQPSGYVEPPPRLAGNEDWFKT